MRTITVTSPRENEPYVIPLDPDGNISVATLNLYFPYANGLIYRIEGKRTALLLEDAKLIVNPDVKEYEVNIATNETVQTENTLDKVFAKVSKAKADQILGYRKIIMEGPPENDAKETIRKLKISSLQKSQITDIRNAPVIKKKQRQVFFGWKHRFIKDQNYILRKEHQGGGQKVLVLNKTIEYKVTDLLSAGVKLFDSEQAISVFSKSIMKLGLGDKGDDIEQFLDYEKNEVGLFDFLEIYDIKFTRINLYLKTTTKQEFLELPEDCTSKIGSSEDALKTSTFNNDNSLQKADEFAVTENHSNIFKIPEAPKRKYSDDKENQIDEKKIKTSFKLKSSSKRYSQLILDSDMVILDQKNPEFLKNMFLESVDFNKNECDLQASNGECVVLNNAVNVASVSYWCLVHSKYGSHEPSLTEESKVNFMFRLLENEEDSFGIDVDRPHEFEPVTRGVQIGHISINGVSFFKIMYVNKQKSVEFYEPNFPKVAENHSLLFDIDKVNGYTSDGYFGLGIVTKCSEICRPKYKWYCDNQVYQEDYGLFWLSTIPSDKVNATWQCTVQCSHGCQIISKKVKFMNQSFSLNNPIDQIVEAKQEEFKIGEFIHGGSQGVVHKGEYKNEVVAIKVLKTYHGAVNRKFIEKEISILQSLNCVSFIRFKAICREEKKIYIIMEYFEGKNLTEVILGDDKLLKIDENMKYHLVLQICKGFCFLHMQQNAIIHRDIKLDNIMVNARGEIKIVDFGLSTFTRAITQFRTTLGKYYIGTLVYMAPELLRKERATLQSDIWAIACVIIEIFSQKAIWDDKSEEEVKQLVPNMSIPDLSEVPAGMRSILKKCFSFNPADRPTIFNLFMEMTKIFQQQLFADNPVL